MPIAIKKEIEKLEKNGKLSLGATKQYLQKGAPYVIPEIQEIYTFWNRELPGGPITFYANELDCWIEMKFYASYEILDHDETGNAYVLKIEIQKEENHYHIQTDSNEIEEIDEVVTMDELKERVKELAKDASKFFQEEGI